MKDLMTAYTEARFGKSAEDDNRGPLSRFADYFAMSKLTPENRELRDTIESSIRDEKHLRDKAKDEIASARSRMKQPASTGGLSWLVDIARSIVPGFAVTAAPKDDGIEKDAVELDEGPLPIGTLSHVAAGGLGGLAGAGAQRGWFGGTPAAQEAAQFYPRKISDIASAIAGEVGGGDRKTLEDALKQMSAEDIALISQKQPALGKMVGRGRNQKLELTALEKIQQLWRKLKGSVLEPASDIGALRAPGQRAIAEKKLTDLLEGKFKGTAKKLMPDVPEAIRKVQSGYRRTSRRVPIPKGWKTGAGIGAAAATLPFVLYNLIRARRVRSQGGPATGGARRRAIKLLAEADKMRGGREQLLTKLPK